MKIQEVHKVFKVHKVFLAFCFMNFINFQLSFAQDVKVTAGIDSTVILIGNQTHLHLKVTYDAKNSVPKIQWPVIADSLIAKVHVVSKSKIDTLIPDHANPTVQVQTQDLVITSFDSGYYAIPPFQFVVNGDTAHPVLSDALLMQVRTLPVDTAKGFRDIKGPIQVKFPLIIILMYVGIALVLVALGAWLTYYFIKKRKKKPALVAPKAPPVDPHVKALKALEELALENLWQAGKVKEYYSGISDILRVYLDDRYSLGALEMTTDEIMYALRRIDLGDALKTKLRQILMLSDLVKFAKEQPLPHEHESAMNGAIDFINESTHRLEPVADNKQETVTPPQPQTPVA
ncbi:MAG: hypothetical protein ACLQQ4_03550 [Bacteroidia bacterium]